MYRGFPPLKTVALRTVRARPEAFAQLHHRRLVRRRLPSMYMRQLEVKLACQARQAVFFFPVETAAQQR